MAVQFIIWAVRFFLEVLILLKASLKSVVLFDSCLLNSSQVNFRCRECNQNPKQVRNDDDDRRHHQERAEIKFHQLQNQSESGQLEVPIKQIGCNLNPHTNHRQLLHTLISLSSSIITDQQGAQCINPRLFSKTCPRHFSIISYWRYQIYV